MGRLPKLSRKAGVIVAHSIAYGALATAVGLTISQNAGLQRENFKRGIIIEGQRSMADPDVVWGVVTHGRAYNESFQGVKESLRRAAEKDPEFGLKLAEALGEHNKIPKPLSAISEVKNPVEFEPLISQELLAKIRDTRQKNR